MTDELRSRFERAGQGQVFRFFDSLTPEQQETFLEQASTIDLDEVQHLVDTLVLHPGSHSVPDPAEILPAPYIPVPGQGGDEEEWRRAREAGEEAVRAGRVAAFVVAGGQGTRLGYEGPKGTFPVTPVAGKSLFQVFAEKIRAASERYGVAIPWFILTSKLNHEDTRSFFEDHQYFGLPKEDVHFLIQGLMPAVDPQGNILLADKHEIALSPDGHGGSLRALVRSGSVEVMKERGIDLISYFQVDNPLVHCIDPAFLGFHLLHKSELSSKACLKAYAEEKVGVFVERAGQVQVLEYSDLPEELALAHDETGGLKYRAGSIAIHVFSRDLVDRLGSSSEQGPSLPFHRASKKVPTVDEEGNSVNPADPNGIKFEAFVFDAIPFARNPIVVQTLRENDFSPVKNAEGKDSPQTARDDQLRQFARWARAAGLDVPVDDTGLPAFEFEIGPVYADTQAAFVERARSSPPQLKPGTVLD